jgi:hypothetical protein
MSSNIIYNINDFSPRRICSIKTSSVLKVSMRNMLRFESIISDKLIEETIDEVEREYILNLIHEGRSSASTLSSTILNLQWYEKEHPERVKETWNVVYHYCLLFCIYMQSLMIFANLKNKEGE